MELFEALYTTRAMRRMQKRDVPDELIPPLLDAAIRARRAAAGSRTGASSSSATAR